MRPKPINHGTRYAYQSRKCRCAACRAWKAQDMAAYRRRHPTQELAREEARRKGGLNQRVRARRVFGS